MKRIETKWLMVLLAIAMMVSLVTVVSADPEIEANYGFIPNSGEASVSKVELTNFSEVARYYTAPRDTPLQWRTSRIAMDEDGNAWVINTGADGSNLQGSIVRIQADTTGLTTHEYPASVLPFGDDEAVKVFDVGAPGEIPRAIAIDAEGYIWVGFYSGGYLQKYEYNGGTLTAVGEPFRYGDGTANNIKFYEMKFAPDGILWMSSRGSKPDVPGTEGIFSFDGGAFKRENVANPYSLLIADDGTVYATSYSNALHIRDPATGTWSSVTITGSSQNRGMAFDDYGRIWIASTVGTTGGTVVYSYNITAGASGPTYILTSGTTPVGVGKDAAGNIWAVCRSDAMSQGWIEGFNPETGDKVGAIQVGNRPYAYGDFVVVAPPVEELTVTKTAETSYIRTHEWDINKWVETEKGYTIGEEKYPKIWLYTNGSGDETAYWTVDVTYEGYVDSSFTVSGEIFIENTGDVDAVITSIDDLLAEMPIDVCCGVDFPYTLPVGGTLTCEYVVAVDDKVEDFNEVTVTTERDMYVAYAEIVWGDPDEEVNEIVTIKDIGNLFGEVDLGEVIAPNNWTFLYTEDFAWADYGADGCGSFAYDNTATIVETEQSASATLKVNVQCYDYETAYAKNGDDAIAFIPTFANWGWTNPIEPGTYEMELWAGAAQCDTSKGTLVGSVTVMYGDDGYVTVTYNLFNDIILEETHVYAGETMFPKVERRRELMDTVAPGQYYNNGPFDGSEVYVIAHAVVGIPNPTFGPLY